MRTNSGCLMSCAWKEPKCRIGLIVGTGTNACYLEDLGNVGLWEEQDEDKEAPQHVIINTEWGAFGDNGELDFIKTKWDEAVDEGSLNPGKQTFEKMISGMYMGELTRYGEIRGHDDKSSMPMICFSIQTSPDRHDLGGPGLPGEQYRHALRVGQILHQVCL